MAEIASMIGTSQHQPDGNTGFSLRKQMSAFDTSSMFSVPMPPVSRRRIGASAREILKEIFGYDDFRPGQEGIVDLAAQGRDELVLMPTGGGKSLCFQIPGLQRPGMALVVSPLVSLMKDQVDTLRSKGIRAAALKTPMSNGEIAEIHDAVKSGSLDFLYVAPERLGLHGFRSLIAQSPIGLSMVIVDEAHCISNWGHDFRESYLKIGDFLRAYEHVPVMAVTATADDATMDEITKRLGIEGCVVFKSSFDRPNIRIEMRNRTTAEKDILDFVTSRPNDSGIVFCSTRKKVEEYAEFLREHGVNAVPYHAMMDEGAKTRNQERFLSENPVVAVATVAFGMGIDKPDVRYVVHLELPTSVEAYYQEIGRAGRDGRASEAVVFAAEKDAVQAMRNLSLELDAMAEGDGSRGHVMNRIAKLQEMHGIFESSRCRRVTLLGAFGESHGGGCGNCDRCLRPHSTMDATLEGRLVVKAVSSTGQHYGQSYLIEVLHGLRTERVAANEHDTLSVFGQGSNVGRKRFQSLIRQMRVDGHLSYNPKTGAIELGELAWPLLQGKTTLEVAGIAPRVEATPAVKSHGAGLPETVRARLVALVALRQEASLETGADPRDILSDRAIEQLLAAMPSSVEELEAVDILSAATLASLGERLLSALGGPRPLDLEASVSEFSLF
jgi:ATP-dependent DNA helicase RecQ